MKCGVPPFEETPRISLSYHLATGVVLYIPRCFHLHPSNSFTSIIQEILYQIKILRLPKQYGKHVLTTPKLYRHFEGTGNKATWYHGYPKIFQVQQDSYWNQQQHGPNPINPQDPHQYRQHIRWVPKIHPTSAVWWAPGRWVNDTEVLAAGVVRK